MGGQHRYDDSRGLFVNKKLLWCSTILGAAMPIVVSKLLRDMLRGANQRKEVQAIVAGTGSSLTDSME